MRPRKTQLRVARRRTPASRPPANPRALRRADMLCWFGPTFFRSQLGTLARDRCSADPQDLPVVLVELAGGDVLEICHVIGAAPRWIALAAYDRGASASTEVETVLVPYEQITKVRIRGRRPDDVVGFDTGHSAALIGPGELSPTAPASPGTTAAAGKRRRRARR